MTRHLGVPFLDSVVFKSIIKVIPGAAPVRYSPDFTSASLSAMTRSRSHFTSTLKRKGERRQLPPTDGEPQLELRPDLLLNVEQMFVNEALVQKILACERDEETLLASESTLNRLLADQVAAREQERLQMARALQEQIERRLLPLRAELAGLCADLETPAVQGRAAAALDKLDSTIASTRELIADTRPFELELGLAAAVQYELDRFERASGVACHLSTDPGLGSSMLPNATVLHLYRALQACLDNVEQHAMAEHVDVSIRMDERALSMTVSDDGIGFDVDQPARPGAFGLMGTKLRLEMLGGHMAVTSARPLGTTVTLSVPLPQGHSAAD